MNNSFTKTFTVLAVHCPVYRIMLKKNKEATV